MRAGVSTACIYPALLEDSLLDLVKMGVKNTEIFINTDCELKTDFINLLNSILKEYGASCCSVHPFTCPSEPMMLFSSYKRRVNDIIDYYKYFFQAMNILGAKIFVFHGNKSLTPVPEELYFERFAILAEAAKEFGVIVAQENVSRCQSRSLSFMTEMSRYLGDMANFVLDVKQAIRAGEDPEEIAGKLGNKIIHVHMSDHGKKGDCLLVGDGEFNISRFLSVLKNDGFNGSVVLELYRSNYSDISELADNYNFINQTINKL